MREISLLQLVVRNLNHEDQTFIEIYALAVVHNLKTKKRER